MAISKTEFAEALNISPAIITHISSGRNKPGVEILQKILQQYTSINAEWLLIGKGYMKKTEGFNKEIVLGNLKHIENTLHSNIEGLQGVNTLINQQIETLKQ